MKMNKLIPMMMILLVVVPVVIAIEYNINDDNLMGNYVVCPPAGGNCVIGIKGDPIGTFSKFRLGGEDVTTSNVETLLEVTEVGTSAFNQDTTIDDPFYYNNLLGIDSTTIANLETSTLNRKFTNNDGKTYYCSDKDTYSCYSQDADGRWIMEQSFDSPEELSAAGFTQKDLSDEEKKELSGESSGGEVPSGTEPKPAEEPEEEGCAWYAFWCNDEEESSVESSEEDEIPIERDRLKIVPNDISESVDGIAVTIDSSAVNIMKSQEITVDDYGIISGIFIGVEDHGMSIHGSKTADFSLVEYPDGEKRLRLHITDADGTITVSEIDPFNKVVYQSRVYIDDDFNVDFYINYKDGSLPYITSDPEGTIPYNGPLGSFQHDVDSGSFSPAVIEEPGYFKCIFTMGIADGCGSPNEIGDIVTDEDLADPSWVRLPDGRYNTPEGIMTIDHAGKITNVEPYIDDEEESSVESSEEDEIFGEPALPEEDDGILNMLGRAWDNTVDAIFGGDEEEAEAVDEPAPAESPAPAETAPDKSSSTDQISPDVDLDIDPSDFTLTDRLPEDEVVFLDEIEGVSDGESGEEDMLKEVETDSSSDFEEVEEETPVAGAPVDDPEPEPAEDADLLLDPSSREYAEAESQRRIAELEDDSEPASTLQEFDENLFDKAVVESNDITNPVGSSITEKKSATDSSTGDLDVEVGFDWSGIFGDDNVDKSDPTKHPKPRVQFYDPQEGSSDSGASSGIGGDIPGLVTVGPDRTFDSFEDNVCIVSDSCSFVDTAGANSVFQNIEDGKPVYYEFDILGNLVGVSDVAPLLGETDAARRNRLQDLVTPPIITTRTQGGVTYQCKDRECVDSHGNTFPETFFTEEGVIPPPTRDEGIAGKLPFRDTNGRVWNYDAKKNQWCLGGFCQDAPPAGTSLTAAQAAATAVSSDEPPDLPFEVGTPETYKINGKSVDGTLILFDDLDEGSYFLANDGEVYYRDEDGKINPNSVGKFGDNGFVCADPCTDAYLAGQLANINFNLNCDPTKSKACESCKACRSKRANDKMQAFWAYPSPGLCGGEKPCSFFSALGEIFQGLGEDVAQGQAIWNLGIKQGWWKQPAEGNFFYKAQKTFEQATAGIDPGQWQESICMQQADYDNGRDIAYGETGAYGAYLNAEKFPYGSDSDAPWANSAEGEGFLNLIEVVVDAVTISEIPPQMYSDMNDPSKLPVDTSSLPNNGVIKFHLELRPGNEKIDIDGDGESDNLKMPATFREGYQLNSQRALLLTTDKDNLFDEVCIVFTETSVLNEFFKKQLKGNALCADITLGQALNIEEYENDGGTNSNENGNDDLNLVYPAGAQIHPACSGC